MAYPTQNYLQLSHLLYPLRVLRPDREIKGIFMCTTVVLDKQHQGLLMQEPCLRLLEVLRSPSRNPHSIHWSCSGDTASILLDLVPPLLPRSVFQVPRLQPVLQERRITPHVPSYFSILSLMINLAALRHPSSAPPSPPHCKCVLHSQMSLYTLRQCLHNMRLPSYGPLHSMIPASALLSRYQ